MNNNQTKTLLLILMTLCCSVTAVTQTLHTLRNNQVELTVSEKGAEMMSIRAYGKEYLWQGDARFWRNRAPVMFPVNVRFRDDSFTFAGKSYSMPMMGIAMNMIMPAKTHKRGNAITFSFVSNDSILTHHYPFPFKLDVTYSLHANSLTHSLTLYNTGNDTMYYALGVHPGFALELNDSLTRVNYELHISGKPITLTRTGVKSGLLTHEQSIFLRNETSIRMDDARIDKTGMFFGQHGLKQIGLSKTGKSPFLILDTGNFPNLNLWSPPGVPFVCLESMASQHDYVDAPTDITSKPQLLRLAPHKHIRYYYSIKLFPK